MNLHYAKICLSSSSDLCSYCQLPFVKILLFQFWRLLEIIRGTINKDRIQFRQKNWLEVSTAKSFDRGKHRQAQAHIQTHIERQTHIQAHIQTHLELWVCVTFWPLHAALLQLISSDWNTLYGNAKTMPADTHNTHTHADSTHTHTHIFNKRPTEKKRSIAEEKNLSQARQPTSLKRVKCKIAPRALNMKQLFWERFARQLESAAGITGGGRWGRGETKWGGGSWRWQQRGGIQTSWRFNSLLLRLLLLLLLMLMSLSSAYCCYNLATYTHTHAKTHTDTHSCRHIAVDEEDSHTSTAGNFGVTLQRQRQQR